MEYIPTGFFEKNGYEVVRNIFSKDLLNYLQIVFNMQVERTVHDNKIDWLTPKLEQQVPYSYYFYGTIYADSLLSYCRDLISKVVNKRLGETYSYWRYYKYGAALWEHCDREACQYSATISINSSNKWPICLIIDDEIREIDLDDGDILVYKGMDIPHFRYTYMGKKHTQLFIHYVDLDGPYSSYYKDGRIVLGTDAVKKDN